LIEALNWEGRTEKEENPFLRGSTRPIRVTLHTSSFKTLTNRQEVALKLLRELSALDDIDLLDTSPDAPYHFTIDPLKPGEDHYDVTAFRGSEAVCYTGVSFAKQQLVTAQCVAQNWRPDDPTVAAAIQDVLTARAHVSLGRDLLVTESEFIFHTAARHVATRANSRPILEAVKIIGLLLRSRNKYVFGTERQSFLEPTAFSRSLYYWVLSRHRTPNMWRYHSACAAASTRRLNELVSMAQSVLGRCRNALRATDLIGEAFYAPNNDGSGDDTTYHFDYLTLLLVGALDAQARIAHRVYRIKEPPIRRVNFRGGAASRFLQALKTAGATELYGLLTDSRVQAVMTLLFEVRNTIHSASLGSNGFHTTGRGPGWIEVDEGDLATKLWDSATTAGGAEAWGLEKLRLTFGSDGPLEQPIRLEPFRYATQLVRECINLVDRIAAATNVELLFDGQSVPLLADGPEGRRDWPPDVPVRLDILN